MFDYQSYRVQNLTREQQQVICDVSKVMDLPVELLCAHLRGVEYLLYKREKEEAERRKSRLMSLSLCNVC